MLTAADELSTDLPEPWLARPFVLDHDPEDYLRIVANPFLAFFVVVIALGILWAVSALAPPSSTKNTIIPLSFVLAFFLHWRFYQYHCLDCGGTGRLTKWKRHTCPVSEERRRLGRRRLLRGPTPAIQVIAWVYILCMVAIAAEAYVYAWSRR